MSSDPTYSSRIGARLRSFALLAGLLGGSVGALVLLGWSLDVPALKGLRPGLAQMQPSTALGLMLAGLALVALRCEPPGRWGARVGLGLASVVTLIGLLTLAEHLGGVNLGVDLVLGGGSPGAGRPPAPGRMSLMTAVGLSCLGGALVLLDAPARPVRWAAQGLALTTVLLAGLDLIGYSYGVRFLYRVEPYSSMALHTATTLFVLGLGSLAARPGRGPMARLVADDPGGWLLRNVLPWAVLLPPVLGWLRAVGEDRGLFNDRFGSALLVLACVLALAGLLWWVAGRLSLLDEDRRRGDLASIRDERRLRLALDAARLVAWEWDIAVGSLRVSETAAEVFGLLPGTPLERIEQGMDLVYPDDIISNRAIYERAIADRGGYLIEYRLVRPIDAAVRWMEERGEAIVGASGRVERLVGIVMDVTERKHAEEEASDVRSRLASTLAANAVGTWEVDPGAGLVLGDANLARMFGITPQEAAGGSIERYIAAIHPDDRGRVDRAFRHALESGEDYEAEYRVVVGEPGVEPRWLVARGQVRRDESGRVVGMPGVVVDITGQKRAEEELQDARSRLESTLAAGEVGTWVFDIKANVVRADPNLASLFGVTPNEAAGGPLEAYTRAIHPDDRDQVAAAIGQAIAAGDGYESSYRIVGPGGAVRWVIARGQVERDASGHAARLPGVVIDVTGQRRAEERLRESEARFRGLFDSMDEGFCVIEMLFDVADRPCDYRFLEMNPAFERHTGLSAMLGRTIREVAPDLEASWYEIYGRVARTGEPIRFVSEAPAQSLGGRWFDVYAFRLGGPGSPKVAVLFNDITARKQHEIERSRLEGDLRQLAADLSEADRRKDEFLATLAHELRNPLAPIRNGLRIMKLAGDDRQAVDESRTLMERQVAHMVRLIDDLMDVSRITRNKLELRRERVDLASVVRNAVDASTPLVEAAGHELITTLPGRPVLVDADPTRLAQVFANLLNNAAKYTEPGGKIALTAESRDGEVVVTVRDTGVGIPPEMLPQVFTMFTQVDRSLERSQGGLGIGLSLVRTLVELHGGSVEARSPGHGLGSEFAVRLPVVTSAPAPRATPGAGSGGAESTGRRRILVVDDNVDSARTMARLLKLLGHETRSAHDGGAAVAAAEEYRPELILLDIGLPVMNGYEVARAIRRLPWGRSVAIVALTGWGQEADRSRSKEAGFDRHLVKPVDPADLESLLDDLQPVPT